MATTSHILGEDDETDPFKMFLPAADTDTISSIVEPQDQEYQLQHHFLRSVDSTVVTRQLHSRGLSFQLWPAATTLVSLLDHSRTGGPLSSLHAAGQKQRLRILELGSGTGLVGIVAAVILAADVTLTDLPHVLPNIQFNADANAAVVEAAGGSVQVAPLRWGEAEDVEQVGREFDLVLASDVVYYSELYEPLLKTLRLLFYGGGGGGEGKEMVMVMAHLKRWKKDSAFFKKAKKMFETEVIHVDSPRDGSRTGVAVYRLKRRSKNSDSTKTGGASIDL